MVDAYVALRQIILTDPQVAALTEKVFIGELPLTLAKEMSIKCVLIEPDGGFENRSFTSIVKHRADIWSFGENYFQISKLDQAIFEVLSILDRVTIENVLIHSIQWSGGPFMARVGQAGWAALWRSVTIASDIRSTGT